jgi:predicted MFS family arabinose efflux permease
MFLFIEAIGGVIAIFASDYVTLIVGRIINGTGSSGAGMVAFVMGDFIRHKF